MCPDTTGLQGGTRIPGGASTLGRKIRRNISWGRTHGWANLLEEHDWQPRTRAARAWRTWRWLQDNPPTGPATAVFLVGAQRSGTNMMVHGLDEAPEVRSYNEGDRRAYRDFALRGDEVVERLVASSRQPLVLFKPLIDSHRVLHLLDDLDLAIPPKAVWAFRDVDGRVRSYLAKFGDANLRVLQAFSRGEIDNHWMLGGIDEEAVDLIARLDVDAMTPATGAALFWWLRNRLYLTLGLDQRPDVHLASYGMFLQHPEQAMRRLCDFLGMTYRADLVAHISPRRPATRGPIAIDPAVREQCRALQQRLDQAVTTSPDLGDGTQMAP